MTKKAERILHNLENEFELYVSLYSENFTNYYKCYNVLNEEKDRCMEMVSSMFHFGLLKEKDFHGLYQEIIRLHDSYINRTNWLYKNKR